MANEESAGLTLSRRQLLAASAAGAVVGLGTAGFPFRPLAQDASYELAFAFITRRPDLTVPDFRARYEGEHAVRAAASMKGIRRYARNYVERALGEPATFDVISEFGFPPGGALNVCGRNIDPNWSKSRSVPVTDGLVAGTPWSAEKGPVKKVGILLRRQVALDDARFGRAIDRMSQLLAKQFASTTDRISLHVFKAKLQDTHACVDSEQVGDALFMMWPKAGTVLPDRFEAPDGLLVTSVLDLLAYASDVPTRS